ncbi:DUF6401 family natural product biosynthesis protein [Planomonospora parontospora]|uniref:DUF6401 family natural product biosynthesis protein n=1 Tax=Planomonospora parontospora TaxID=58119 RepID=UPI001943FE05|nr:DUF6401 family natural product biosynthesis protein [Planomonospora parontospora]GGL19881.1 hypothetical protein GCM10014719_22500 [Planomonospora parontospora subsp. antibiotica]GII13676.1 hypothetical protein Ppa05_04020 [Planomonospora parontospora subsp. antibiotica]
MSERSWPARLRAEFAQRVLDLRVQHPGVGAALDQHAAEVRQAIVSLGQQVGPVSLLGYLIGFWDGAHEAGWRAPGPDQPLDFAALRLSAVCLMLDPAPAAA